MPMAPSSANRWRSSTISRRSSREVAEIGADRYIGQLRLVESLMPEERFIAGQYVTLADCVAMATLQYASDF